MPNSVDTNYLLKFVYTKYNPKKGFDSGEGILTFGTKDGATCNLQKANFKIGNNKFKLTSPWKQTGNKQCPDNIDSKIKDFFKNLESSRLNLAPGYGGNLYEFYDSNN